MNKQEEQKVDNSNQLAKSSTNNLGVINLLDEKQLAAAEVFLKKIIASDKGGVKSVNEGLAVLMRANDLNLPCSTCIEHIHVINGKTGVDVHIIKSLLSRAGVTWEMSKDYAPQYQYTDGNTIYLETQLPEYVVRCRTPKEAEEKTTDDKVGVYPLRYYADLKGNMFNELELNAQCVKCINRFQAISVAKEGKYPVIRVPAQPIDFVTEYTFKRYKVINGKEREITAKGHFSFTEAQTAELFIKDTYKKYARIMIANRAFVFGARDIADDLIMGVMETSELDVVVGNSNPSTDYYEDYTEIKD